MTPNTTEASKPKLATQASSPNLEWLGASHWILLSGAETGGRMTLAEGVYPPGVGTPPHMHHGEDEMFEVIEGRFKFMAGESFIEAGPGEVVWAPRGIPHAFTCISDAPGRLRFTVTPGGIDAMFAELAQLPAGPPEIAKILEICGRYNIDIHA